MKQPATFTAKFRLSFQLTVIQPELNIYYLVLLDRRSRFLVLLDEFGSNILCSPPNVPDALRVTCRVLVSKFGTSVLYAFKQFDRIAAVISGRHGLIGLFRNTVAT